jgi:hypothetical protein
MIRTSMLALGLSSSLLMAGCASTGTFTGVDLTKIPEQGQVVLTEAGKIARSLCGFEPIAATIGNLISGGSTMGAFEIASMVCQAVKGAALAASPKKPTPLTVVVRGVRIDGILHPKHR